MQAAKEALYTFFERVANPLGLGIVELWAEEQHRLTDDHDGSQVPRIKLKGLAIVYAHGFDDQRGSLYYEFEDGCLKFCCQEIYLRYDPRWHDAELYCLIGRTHDRSCEQALFNELSVLKAYGPPQQG